MFKRKYRLFQHSSEWRMLWPFTMSFAFLNCVFLSRSVVWQWNFDRRHSILSILVTFVTEFIKRDSSGFVIVKFKVIISESLTAIRWSDYFSPHVEMTQWFILHLYLDRVLANSPPDYRMNEVMHGIKLLTKPEVDL
jgi:hypothetical protein